MSTLPRESALLWGQYQQKAIVWAGQSLAQTCNSSRIFVFCLFFQGERQVQKKTGLFLQCHWVTAFDWTCPFLILENCLPTFPSVRLSRLNPLHNWAPAYIWLITRCLILKYNFSLSYILFFSFQLETWPKWQLCRPHPSSAQQEL